MAKGNRASHANKRNTLPRSAQPEYAAWIGMRDRCRNPKSVSFHQYGARGITICDRWFDSFEAFVSDIGPRPSMLHSVDRIDNNKGYCKENCRWATQIEQQNNTRANKTITHDGRTLTIAEWARVTGIFVKTIAYRRRMGWPAEECLRVKDNRAGRTTRYIGVSFGNATEH
jgi:hypothetical protein